MNSSDWIVAASFWIAVASFGAAIAALVVSIYAILRSNKTASAATLVTLNEALRQAWERCLKATTVSDYDLAELLNLLEIACAVYLEKSLTGNSRNLMGEYLGGVLSHLISAPGINDQAYGLLQTRDTFIFIKKFLRQKPSTLSVTDPPKWFELRP